MIRGVCINDDQSIVLRKGEHYYLFDAGNTHYMISRFPNRYAHTGFYEKEKFKVIEETWPEEPTYVDYQLDKEKIYKATLIWVSKGYQTTELREYYIKPLKTHGYFFHDRECKKFGGCYPLHWFIDFEEVSHEEINVVISDNHAPMQFEQMDLFDFEISI